MDPDQLAWLLAKATGETSMSIRELSGLGMVNRIW